MAKYGSDVRDLRSRLSPRLSGRGDEAGFTLIELGLVILIIGVMLAITVPRLGNRAYKQLESEARKLALGFRYIRHAAILNGRTYRLVFDIENRAYWAEVGQVDAGGPTEEEEEDEDDSDFFTDESEIEQQEVFTKEVDGPLGTRKLPEPIGFSDVNLPMVTGKIQEGVVWATFYPDGYVDVSVVHLDNGQDVFTLYVLNSITGQAFVEPGYLSWGE